jgi:PDZ domain
VLSDSWFERVLPPLVALLAAACASAPSPQYQATTGLTPAAINDFRAAPAPRAPALVRSTDSAADLLERYSLDGYVLIGYSSLAGWRGRGTSQVARQAATVGADLAVIVGHGAAVLTPAQAAADSGDSSARNLQYGVLYFVKKQYVFGARYRELTAGERAALGASTGVSVAQVIVGSPAFLADVLPGDVILAVDKQPVSRADACTALLAKHRGETVIVSMLRNGSPVTKAVSLFY